MIADIHDELEMVKNQNKKLQKAYDELNDFEKSQVKKLLEQITLMKCCGNCSNARNCPNQSQCKTEKYKNWELIK